MSSTKRVALSIRHTILQAPPRSFQSNSGFLGACFTSVINHPQARNVTESTSEMAGAMADTAKAGSMKAMETGREMGEKAMHTVDSALDAAKETTQKMKETVVDEADDDRQPSDSSSVEDVRTRERGYD